MKFAKSTTSLPDQPIPSISFESIAEIMAARRITACEYDDESASGLHAKLSSMIECAVIEDIPVQQVGTIEGEDCLLVLQALHAVSATESYNGAYAKLMIRTARESYVGAIDTVAVPAVQAEDALVR